MKFVHGLMCHRLLLGFLLVLAIFLAKGQSVLQSGQWVKVGVTETGLYKLDRNFLNNIGFPVNSIDPRTLKVYGNGGGGMLPQSNAEERILDLAENAIYAVGESDGSLDNGDYFLFYGRSPDKVEWSASGVDYENNLYSDTTYYFITYDNSNGLRVSQQASEVEQPTRITEFDDAIIHESDVVSVERAGRNWYGDSFSPATRLTADFDFELDNVASHEAIEILVLGRSESEASFEVSLNDANLGTISVDAIPSGPGTTYSIKGLTFFEEFDLSGSSDEINVRFDFNPGAEGATIAHLDWFIVKVKRILELSSDYLSFRSKESVNDEISTYEVGGASSSTKIWDVTNPAEPVEVEYSLESGSAVFSATSDILREFIAFEGNDFPSPRNFGEVQNQSIKSNVSIDGLVVTNPKFLTQAKRLADFHSSNSGLQVAVVTTQEVYNEFSSGMQDVSAIRDFAKYVYDEGGQLKYLLLFGDCSYDYKDRVEENTNYVPVYEARQSLHPIFSYSSDDYFGFLEDSEGEWEESSAGDHTLEIGIGRLPVNTTKQAETVVDKIIRYSTSTATLGKWRNEIVYVVDDGDFGVHMDHGEALSAIVDDNSYFNSRKLYLDAFEQEIFPSKEESAALKKAIAAAIKDGAFFIDFIGHGNESVWMDEFVFTKSVISSLTNYQRLPIFVTATCQFGKYDAPRQVSGAEELILGEQGAVALLTTTRPVFANTNYVLNEAFHEAILRIGLSGDVRLGDILKYTKNLSLQGPVNRNFALLGDPMMRPAYPNFDVVVDQFQGMEPDTLSALERVTITGSIQSSGLIQPDFNGQLSVDLFDIPTEKITKGQENNQYTYFERDNALFRGAATVENGEFSVEFIVPRNISYQNKPGKLVFYAMNESGGQDAAGSTKNLVLGGTNKFAAEDTTPPELEVYLNEPSFRNGSRVGSGAVLIARFSDESGMNISNLGFDRGITLELNGELFEVNTYYTADIDDFTKGTVLYPLQDLEPGKYTAKIKGSDVYNNSVEETVQFVVSNQPILQTYDFKVYPNPSKTFTRFSFDHDREGESLDVEMSLYSLNGDRVILKNETVLFSERQVDLRMDFSGDRVMDGLYVYRLVISSQLDGATSELSGRLVIRN